MYDIYHKNLNTTFLNMFTPISDIHHHFTRKSISQYFYKKYSRTNYKKNFIATKGINIWDDIPNHIKSEKRYMFKHKLMYHYINKYI